MSELPTVYSLAEVAEHLKISLRRLRALLREHGIGRKLGRDVRLTAEDVARLLEALPRPAGPGSRGMPSVGDPFALERARRLVAEGTSPHRRGRGKPGPR